jgi:hypothetical protein
LLQFQQKTPAFNPGFLLPNSVLQQKRRQDLPGSREPGDILVGILWISASRF